MNTVQPADPRPSPPSHSRRTPGQARRTTALRLVSIVIGAVLALLGLFWALQGAGAIHVRPILCAAECKPITRSDTWLLVGAIACVTGIAIAARPALQWARKRHAR